MLKATSSVQTPLMSDRESTKKTLAFWQNRVLTGMIIGYAVFYLVRQNFVMTFPSLQEEFGYSKVQLGMVLSVFSILYGLGKVVSGALSDRSHARYFMAAGLFLSALVNVLMGCSQSIAMFMSLWGLNACFQSMGAPPCARLLTHWFPPKQVGTKWAIWNVSHQIGGAAVFVAAGYVINTWGWRQAFFLPSWIAMGTALYLVWALRDSPQDVGLIPFYAAQKNAYKKLSMKDIFIKIFKNKAILLMCFANFFLYIVRMGVFNWGPTFLREFKGSTLHMAGWQAAVFEIAGIFGGIAAGTLSDRFFKGRRAPVGVTFMLLLSFVILFLWQCPAGHFFLDACALFGIGFLIYGPQVLIGVAAADFASRKAAGAASGLTGTFGYLGSTCAGVGIGWLVESQGWDMVFLVFVAAALLGTACIGLTWKVHPQAGEKS